MQKEAIYEEYKGTYADTESDMISKDYGWNHSLSEVINSLIEAGLIIEYLNEYDGSPYDIFPSLVKNNEGLFEMPSKTYPLVFEVKARKLIN